MDELMDALQKENAALRAALTFCQDILTDAGEKLSGRGAYLDVMDGVADTLWAIKDMDTLMLTLQYGNNAFVRVTDVVQSVLDLSTSGNILANYKKLDRLFDAMRSAEILELLDELEQGDHDNVYLAKVARLRADLESKPKPGAVDPDKSSPPQ